MKVTTMNEYEQWKQDNEYDIIAQYVDSELFEYPNHIFEGVLDDDYQDVQEHYIDMLDLNDVPEEFIVELYHERRK